MARGPVAEQIEGLTWFLTIVGGVVYVLVLVLFVVPMVRRRRAGDDDSDPDARGPVPARTANRSIVLGGVVLPVLVLPVALGVSELVMRDLPFDAPRDALVVEVVGRQWSWSVRYPEHNITLTDEMRIPVDRPVEVRLTSIDVIHSFWVPKLAGKIDALPDGVNTLVIEADEPGQYRGVCAEFCGLEHAAHGFVVVAEPPERFAAWLARQRGR